MNISEKRREVTKEIVRGGVKFCVGAFFGAIAAYIARASEAPKIERYAAMAGGMIIGSMVGDQASDQVCLGIDRFADTWSELQKANEEEGQRG